MTHTLISETVSSGTAGTRVLRTYRTADYVIDTPDGPEDMPGSTFQLYWNGPGSRVFFGVNVTRSDGWMTPLDGTPAAMTRHEARAIMDEFAS